MRPGESGIFSRTVENLIAEWRGLPPDLSRSKGRGTKELPELIQSVLQSWHVGTNGPLDLLANRWIEIAGPTLAGRSHPLAIKGDSLLVAASNAVIRNELQLQSRKILAAVRTVPGCEGVKSLHLRAG